MTSHWHAAKTPAIWNLGACPEMLQVPLHPLHLLPLRGVDDARDRRCLLQPLFALLDGQSQFRVSSPHILLLADKQMGFGRLPDCPLLARCESTVIRPLLGRLPRGSISSRHLPVDLEAGRADQQAGNGSTWVGSRRNAERLGWVVEGRWAAGPRVDAFRDQALLDSVYHA